MTFSLRSETQQKEITKNSPRNNDICNEQTKYKTKHRQIGGIAVT